MRKIITSLFVAIFITQFMIVGLDGLNEESSMIVDDHDEKVQFTARQSNTNGCNFTNSADGLGGPVWQNGTSYALHSIVEWPAHSGQFYQTTVHNTTTEIGTPLSDWIGPCTCAEIAEASNIVWNTNQSYNPWQIVIHNGTYWIAQDAGAPDGEEPGAEEPTSSGISGNFYTYWAPCASNRLCSSFNGQGGLVWNSTQSYLVNDTVEWPANSGQFWQNTASDGLTAEPAPDGKWIGPCSCKDIWLANTTSPVWDSNTVYDSGMIVEFPGNSGDIWIAISPSTTAGVDPTYPWADGNEWTLCSSDSSSNGGPCSSDVVGVWTNGTNVTSGEVYEYPANSGVLYVVNPGSPFWSVSAPDIDMDVWTPCDNTPPAGDPCDSPVVVGVWVSGTNVTSGEVYEYPANSGILYQVNTGGPFMTVSAPDIDLDVWSQIDCPCLETWEANGEPVWDNATLNYSGNYVVEWPAGSGLLYISEGGGLTSAGEPGIDQGHWIPCFDLTPEPEVIDEPEEAEGWLPSVGVFGTIVAITMSVFMFSRRHQNL